VKVKEEEDSYKEFIVEVKPLRQLKQPAAPTGRITEKRMTDYTNQMQTYLTNLSKFKSAKDNKN
jgi:ribosomal protein S18